MRTSGFVMTVVLSGVILALGSGCQDPAALRLDEGHAALEQRRYDDAMAAADQYLRERPNGNRTASAMYLRGQVIERRTKQSDAEASANLRLAEQHYLKALSLNPDKTLEGFIRVALGNVCYFQHDYAAALNHWTESMDLLPDPGFKTVILYRTGICRQRLGQWADADALFAAVQQQAPGTDLASRARDHQGARGFYVQVAAYRDAASADRLIATLRSQGFAAVRYEKPDNRLQLVRVGPTQTYAQALGLKARLTPSYKDAVIVP